MNSGSEPINKRPAMINPHVAIVTGFQDRMGWNRREVFDALGQCVPEIRHPDLPDHWKGLARVRADHRVQVGHGHAFVNRRPDSRAALK
jgi:hypothetical protein